MLLWSMRLFKSKDEPSVFDIPKTLQANKLTLKLWYSGKQANGAEMYSTTEVGGEDDRMYLEPATQYLNINREILTKLKDSGYTLKLYGSFFKGKGIPERYLAPAPKPDKLPVFKYESMDIVKD